MVLCADSRFAKPRSFTGAFCVRQKAPKKHAERAVPAGIKFPIGNFQSFLLYFLYFTKSRKIAAEGGGEAAERQKDLIGFVRSCCLCALIRGLENLETSCEGDVFTFFLRRAKRTKKHARGLRTSGLRGRFKALPEVILQKLPAARIETGFVCKTPA